MNTFITYKAEIQQGADSLRRKTRKIFVGSVAVGGDSPITVQSMTKTKTANVKATVEQIKRLEEKGCEIIRVTVPDEDAAMVIPSIRKQIKIPLVADIHFNYRLAIKVIEGGVDKIRINPGNIGSKVRIRQVLERAKEHGIPLRIGVNAGSLEKEVLQKYAKICPQALVESALRHVDICHNFGFENIILSLKASDVPMTIEAYRLISKQTDYPLHLGITEAGTYQAGTIKSAIGIGTLLAEGIGDTIRVSLTGDPVEEVKVGIEILKSLDLRKQGVNLVSCPTCGRLEVDLVSIVQKVEAAVAKVNKPIKLALMGCTVNGPGEAREADIGIACGKHVALLFRKGQFIKKLKENEIIKTVIDEVNNWEEKYAIPI